MPELPEVETVMRGLDPVLTGHKIKSVQTYRKNLRIDFPKDMDGLLKNHTISHLSRRAKYILIHFDHDLILVIHLGMSGRMLIVPAQQSYDLIKHDHMRIEMKGGQQIIYNDPRRFGMVFILHKNDYDAHPIFGKLGVEPLEGEFHALYLKAQLKNKIVPIKQAIMDQNIVVGVGNIYASEALFQAKINPLKPSGDLTMKQLNALVAAIQDVLKRAIKAGGSTLKDYRHANGDLGYFQHNFKVYDRAGQACPTCDCNLSKTGGVTRLVQGGRSTFYCPVKQK